jgi:hypothetical protein
MRRERIGRTRIRERFGLWRSREYRMAQTGKKTGKPNREDDWNRYVDASAGNHGSSL